MFLKRQIGKTVVNKTTGTSMFVHNFKVLWLYIDFNVIWTDWPNKLCWSLINFGISRNGFYSVEIAADALKGRVFEVSLADLQDDEVTYRKFKLIVEDVQGRQCLTNFHGLDMTTDKLRSLVKKWQVCFLIVFIHLDFTTFWYSSFQSFRHWLKVTLMWKQQMAIS